MMVKCLICNKELPVDMTQIIITEGENKYKSVCCSHEGSQELKDLMPGMNGKEKLELINTMEFIDDDADGEVCNYVLVADNKINRDILHKIGFSDDYIREEGLDADGDTIDISPIAFEYCNWWFGDYFGDNEDEE